MIRAGDKKTGFIYLVLGILGMVIDFSIVSKILHVGAIGLSSVLGAIIAIVLFLVSAKFIMVGLRAIAKPKAKGHATTTTTASTMKKPESAVSVAHNSTVEAKKTETAPKISTAASKAAKAKTAGAKGTTVKAKTKPQSKTAPKAKSKAAKKKG